MATDETPRTLLRSVIAAGGSILRGVFSQPASSPEADEADAGSEEDEVKSIVRAVSTPGRSNVIAGRRDLDQAEREEEEEEEEKDALRGPGTRAARALAAARGVSGAAEEEEEPTPRTAIRAFVRDAPFQRKRARPPPAAASSAAGEGGEASPKRMRSSPAGMPHETPGAWSGLGESPLVPVDETPERASASSSAAAATRHALPSPGDDAAYGAMSVPSRPQAAAAAAAQGGGAALVGGPRRRAARQAAAALPKVVVRRLLARFTGGRPVSGAAVDAVLEGTAAFFKQACSQLGGVARRKTIEAADVELLMRGQGVLGHRRTAVDVARDYLSAECMEDLVPVATAVTRSRGVGGGAGQADQANNSDDEDDDND